MLNQVLNLALDDFAQNDHRVVIAPERGHELIRVITRVDSGALATALRNAGYGVTTVKASGMQGEVGIVFIIVNRKNQKHAGYKSFNQRESLVFPALFLGILRFSFLGGTFP